MSDTAQKFLMLGYGVLAFVLVVGLVLLLASLADKAPRSVSERLQVALFVGIPLFFMTIGLVLPAIRTMLLAFKDSFGQKYVGFDNFAWMLTSPDTLVVLRNTAVWVGLTPFLATAIGLVYAILIDGSRFESAYKALVFMPMAISMVGASLIWRFMYDYKETAKDQIGLLNQVLAWLGVQPFDYVRTSPWNTIFLIIILIWIQAGFAMVVLSAAIKNIPTDMVEAARLDGVNPFQMFFRITLPSIRPAILVVYITILIGTLKVFDIVKTMTGGNYNTSVIANEMYDQSFRYDESGKGAALAVFLFVLVLPVVIYQIRQIRRERLESR